MLENTIGQDRMYQTIDVYTSGLSHMYTGPMKPGPMNPLEGPGAMDGPGIIREPYEPIGTHSDFMLGSQNNVERYLNLGEMTGDPTLNQFSLTERYDLSGHDDTLPHLNQSVVDMDNLNDFGRPRDVISGGISRKSTDGYKGLGPAHRINLFDK